VKVEMFVRIAADSADESSSPRRRSYANACAMPDATPEQTSVASPILQIVPKPALKELSPWSGSAAKRVFDCACVLAALPLVTPVLLFVALTVWLTSKGPVFFRQLRVGDRGRLFTILKFRTMMHDANAAYHAVTTDGNQPFTAVGPLLRRWKLDELPQVINVLRGDMSLVGPRPKMPEHAIAEIPCRPGITGAATLAFAREETLLDRIPEHDLENYYHLVVLPTKRRLDAEYMARATFFSDLTIIIKSVLRRWDDSIAERMLKLESLKPDGGMRESSNSETNPHWNGSVPIRVASVSARVGARRSA
jgi:lipopolysaccharide/colanic/teichoic acid biosynthesis glycosyltransferase